MAGFVLITASPLGLRWGFPPSHWIYNRLNRWSFEREEGKYREMVADIRKRLGPVKDGDRHYFEWTLDPSLLPENTPVEKLDHLLREGRLIEANGFRGGGLVVRFVTRRVWGAGTYSLVFWDPKPDDYCILWAQDWWGNQYIDWIDGQWWSTYCSGHVPRQWVSPRRQYYGLHGE